MGGDLGDHDGGRLQEISDFLIELAEELLAPPCHGVGGGLNHPFVVGEDVNWAAGVQLDDQSDGEGQDMSFAIVYCVTTEGADIVLEVVVVFETVGCCIYSVIYV